MTRRARLTQEFGRVASRTNCSGRMCFARFTPAMCRAEATTHGLSFIGCDCVCLTSSRNHQSLTPSELQAAQLPEGEPAESLQLYFSTPASRMRRAPWQRYKQSVTTYVDNKHRALVGTSCMYEIVTVLSVVTALRSWNVNPHAPLATPFYNAGTILQLQITMEFCRPHVHEKQLKPHLQCGTDPTMIRP